MLSLEDQELDAIAWVSQGGSKRKSTRKGTFSEPGERPARTTVGERRHMFDLYEQGHGTHAIANKTGRSTHTVHSVLTQRGTRSLPERNPEPADEESAGRTGVLATSKSGTL